MTALPLGAPYVPPIDGQFIAAPGYVSASGQQLLDPWGASLALYGSTIYLSTQGQDAAWRTGSIASVLDRLLQTATSAGLNLIRVTDYFDSTTVSQTYDNTQIWTNIDYLVTAADRLGMYVMIDLRKGFGNWLISQSLTEMDPANWTTPVAAVASHYATARNVCWYAIYSEPTLPSNSTQATALVTFYTSVLATARSNDANHLLSAGGFNNMNNNLSLSWWQQVYALANNNVCGYETYSQQDLDFTGFVGRHVANLNKPLMQIEFGMDDVLGDAVYSGTPHGDVSISKSEYYRQVYKRGKRAGASSFVFWNLGFETPAPTRYDINPTDWPATWAAVRAAATGIPTGAASASISGASVPLLQAGSLHAANAIGQRSTCDFMVVDSAGAVHYEIGDPVEVDDDAGNIVYSGVVDTSDEYQPGMDATLEHAVACADWHYLADKRRAPVSYASQTAAFIAKDIWTQFLLPEGVLAAFGANILSRNQSHVQDDLDGFDSINNTPLTRDTANAYYGKAAVKLVLPVGAFAGVEVRVPSNAFSNGQQITISGYAKASVSTTGRFYVQSSNGSVGGTSSITVTTAWQRFTKTITLPNPIPLTDSYYALRFDSGSSAQTGNIVWFSAMQMEAAAAASAWQLGGSATVQTGPTITEFVSNYAKVAQCLDALAQAAAFYWQIDTQRVLWLAMPGTQTGPAVTAGIMDRKSGPKVQHASPLYRNRQYVLGGNAQTASQVETRIGDGTATAFTMSYALATVPTVEVKIGAGAFVTKTVGIGALDTGKDWYWNGGKNVVFQDSAGTKLTSADTLRVTYVGQFPTIIQADDVGEQLTTQMREGAGTGIVEDVVTNSGLSTIAAGFELAAGYLSRYAQLGEAVTFRTDMAGFAQGQLVDVYLPAFNILHQQMLIESVSITHDGLTFWYTVKALAGPVNTTWVQFFAALVARAVGTVDKINLGTGSTLTLLQSFTATKAPTATFTTTVYACPIFPMVFPFTLC